jgi:hypothetical protein
MHCSCPPDAPARILQQIDASQMSQSMLSKPNRRLADVGP